MEWSLSLRVHLAPVSQSWTGGKSESTIVLLYTVVSADKTHPPRDLQCCALFSIMCSSKPLEIANKLRNRIRKNRSTISAHSSHSLLACFLMSSFPLSESLVLSSVDSVFFLSVPASADLESSDICVTRARGNQPFAFLTVENRTRHYVSSRKVVLCLISSIKTATTRGCLNSFRARDTWTRLHTMGDFKDGSELLWHETKQNAKNVVVRSFHTHLSERCGCKLWNGKLFVFDPLEQPIL